LAFFLNQWLDQLTKPILLFDAAGLSLFTVIGATKALEHEFGPLQAILLGTITGVGGGTIRDVLLNGVPTVLSANSRLYAITAMVCGAVLVGGPFFGPVRAWDAVIGALLCFTVRVL